MRKLIVFVLCSFFLLPACKKQVKVTSVSTEAIPGDASADAVQDLNYIAELEPIKEALEAEMNVQIGYAAEDLWVAEPECPMLNWASGRCPCAL